jgi:hypothetical protein
MRVSTTVSSARAWARSASANRVRSRAPARWSATPAAARAGSPAALREAADAFDALAWLLWPTDGMDGPLEAGAFRILSVDIDVVPESDDRGTLTWTVTVKLTDVHTLSRLAAEAYPVEAGLIAESLAAAWQFAADPFAPLHSISGIAWQPGPVGLHPVSQKTRPGAALRTT